MRYNPEWEEHVPEGQDPRSIAHERDRRRYLAVREELAAGGARRGELDGLYWLFRMAQEYEQVAPIVRSVPWMERLAVGYIDPEMDGIGPAFGLIAYANVPPDAQEAVRERARLQQAEFGVDAGPWFRLAIRIGERMNQLAVTSPSRAQVTHRVGNPAHGTSGYLLPRHAVDRGQHVTFYDGAHGDVIGDFGECIDAVVVSHSDGYPRGLRRHRCARGIGPGSAVEVTDQNGTVHNCNVLDIDLSFGVVMHTVFPVRFTFDWSSSANGDSGALIKARPCGEPLGMHQGAIFITHGVASQLAYGLCLYQLEDFGGLEFLR